MTVCPVCNEPAKTRGLTPLQTLVKVECGVCGPYLVSNTAIQLLKKVDKNPVAVSKIRQMVKQKQAENREGFTLNAAMVEGFLQDIRLPTVEERIALFIRWVGDRTQSDPGKALQKSTMTDDQFKQLLTYTHCVNEENFYYIVNQCVVLKYLDRSVINEKGFWHLSYGIKLSYMGWAYYEQLKQTVQATARQGVMSLPYGKEAGSHFYQAVLIPAVKDIGLDLRIVDTRPMSNNVANVIEANIRHCAFAIIDLTYNDRNKYYEAGFARALGKPVVYILNVEETGLEQFQFEPVQHGIITYGDKPGSEFKAILQATLANHLPEARYPINPAINAQAGILN